MWIFHRISYIEITLRRNLLTASNNMRNITTTKTPFNKNIFMSVFWTWKNILVCSALFNRKCYYLKNTCTFKLLPAFFFVTVPSPDLHLLFLQDQGLVLTEPGAFTCFGLNVFSSCFGHEVPRLCFPPKFCVCIFFYLLMALLFCLAWEATCMHTKHENTDTCTQQCTVNHTFIRYCWDAHSSAKERETCENRWRLTEQVNGLEKISKR